MTRNTLIFGNGLGRQLSNEHFKLENALQRTFEGNKFFREDRELLSRFCSEPLSHDYPRNEDEFNILSEYIKGCKILTTLEESGLRLLSDDGKKLTDTILRYKTAVGWDLFNYGGKLPDLFINPLSSHLRQYKSHIATLNYDGLLYRPFNENGIFGNYDNAFLIDGFHCNKSTQFSINNLERNGTHDFGYYLHLHGSPLFYGDLESPKKQKFNNIDYLRNSEHLILSDSHHKLEQINSSLLLRTYWDYFRRSIEESEKIIILGYGGLDDHLNTIINTHISDKQIKVVERSEEGDITSRESFWKNKLLRGKKNSLSVIQVPSVLDFTDWK